jgi:aldehyde dehydrogenase (NAD+)/coniferyl-aldehyde dehydrogenase
VAWPLQLAQAYVLPQPLGVVGIVVPWNYPVFLAIGPLAAALAAGNRVMLKPSEHTPRTSALLATMISKTFAADFVTVIEGDAEVGKAFTALPFDHLLFTGSTAVGRDVMRAASENLTPVTLELGGKSPAIVADDASVARAAEDIVYGKLINGGQTCIAPDYVLVDVRRQEAFVSAVQAAVERLYPTGEYTSVIDDRHYSRLKRLLAEARGRGAEVRTLGREPATGSRQMAPTLILNPPDDLGVMREEIFGPILPVKAFADATEAIGFINARPRPLAIYLFTANRHLKERLLQETVSGGVCMNDTLLQIAVDDLPFGGAGASGMGHYHAQEGFDAFSKLKPVFERGAFGIGRMLRPPYSKLHEWMERLLIG